MDFYGFMFFRIKEKGKISDRKGLGRIIGEI